MAKSKEEKQTQQSSEQKEREGAAAPEAERRTRAVVVAVVRDGQSVAQTEEFLSELEFLAETADIDTVCRFTQRLPQPSSLLYVGPGKIEEIASYCADNEIDVAIFDDELSPSQTRVASINATTTADGFAVIHRSIFISDAQHLAAVLRRLHQISGVMKVDRPAG